MGGRWEKDSRGVPCSPQPQAPGKPPSIGTPCRPRPHPSFSNPVQGMGIYLITALGRTSRRLPLAHVISEGQNGTHEAPVSWVRSDGSGQSPSGSSRYTDHRPGGGRSTNPCEVPARRRSSAPDGDLQEQCRCLDGKGPLGTAVDDRCHFLSGEGARSAMLSALFSFMGAPQTELQRSRRGRHGARRTEMSAAIVGSNGGAG